MWSVWTALREAYQSCGRMAGRQYVNEVATRSKPMDESREYEYSDEETTTAHRAAHCPKL